MNRVFDDALPGPLHFPMYLWVNDDDEPIIARREDGRGSLIIYWAMEQIGDEIEPGEHVPEEESVRAVVYRSAGELIPELEGLPADVNEVWYAILPTDEKSEDALHLKVHARESVGQFLSRLREQQARDDKAGHN